ncbi:HK97 family phage prohead protease [Corynebacterium sp.]|uniref:HK97 family phage prohead protease n=1 Tax=Corynebacterium sp. TaxID=1720 RepID=UPI0025C4CDC0|nr:HK97 family phage prohead protease [Corynebacterium sp.]
MTIHVVVGPPASGKSTFVEQNAPTGTPRFDFDRVADTIAGTEVKHDAPQPVVDTVLAMRRGLMGWALDAETTVDELWLINARPTDSTINALAAAGAQFHLCDPGVDECIARAEREGRPEHTIDRIKQWYENPPDLPGEKGGESMRVKDMTVQVKADDADAGDGEFSAYASVFDNIDSYGDVIRKGAFTKTLEDWEASGNTMPLLYGHNFSDPFSNIGAITKAEEDDHGLKISAKIDLDNPTGAQVYRLLKEKRLSQMSFAFDVKEGGMAEVEGESVYELRELTLYECSVVPIGANQETEILAVKAMARYLDAAGKGAVDQLRQALSPPGGGKHDTDPETPEDTTSPGSSHTPDSSESAETKGRTNWLQAKFALLERTAP